MSSIEIIFTARAKIRLENITDYLLKETQSPNFVIRYLDDIENYITEILTLFPESGAPLSDWGNDIRRIVYKEYSFIYKIIEQKIFILTIYKENLP